MTRLTCSYDRHSATELVAELLGGAVSLRGQRAGILLAAIGGPEGLRHQGLATLQHAGLSLAEAQRLLAAVELGRRIVRGAPAHPAITDAEAAFACVRAELLACEREKFVVVVLDIKNRPRHIAPVAIGSVDGCAVDVREVFGPALRERASSILVAHNHPSGDPTPSAEDLRLTERLAEAGQLLGIPLLDHLIVGVQGTDSTNQPRYVSLAAHLHGLRKPNPVAMARC